MRTTASKNEQKEPVLWVYVMHIGLIALLFASPVIADIHMQCGRDLFRKERNLLSSDRVLIRKDGYWKLWCNSKYERLEMKGESALCIIDKLGAAMHRADCPDCTWTLGENRQNLDFEKKVLEINSIGYSCKSLD